MVLRKIKEKIESKPNLGDRLMRFMQIFTTILFIVSVILLVYNLIREALWMTI